MYTHDAYTVKPHCRVVNEDISIILFIPKAEVSNVFLFFHGRCQERTFIQHQEYLRMALWFGFSGTTLIW